MVWSFLFVLKFPWLVKFGNMRLSEGMVNLQVPKVRNLVWQRSVTRCEQCSSTDWWRHAKNGGKCVHHWKYEYWYVCHWFLNNALLSSYKMCGYLSMDRNITCKLLIFVILWMILNWRLSWPHWSVICSCALSDLFTIGRMIKYSTQNGTKCYPAHPQCSIYFNIYSCKLVGNCYQQKHVLSSFIQFAFNSSSF